MIIMKRNLSICTILTLVFLFCLGSSVFSKDPSFPWPEGEKMVLNLSFGGVRSPKPTLGTALPNRYNVKATFLLWDVQADTVNIPAVVKASPDGSMKLSAEKGKAIGPKIKYMPEWKAFGWFTASDRVEWDVEIDKTGKYDVFLEWSVSDESAGNPYVFETGGRPLKGKVGKTGSWETFKSKKIGRVNLKTGLQKMVFKGSSEDRDSGLLDLREIRLVPVK